ncbi:MAG: glycosyltransferase [Lachnospiraceae bacterium]|nr:glycosyltransferase [Lachnospiraceae bacterium]
MNIKDGGSTDDTLRIIKEYESKSRYRVKWTSSPDRGIYDAMNQGYALAEGDIIVFFNDLFCTLMWCHRW